MSRKRRGRRQRTGKDYAASCRKMNSRKRTGWGRNLYRNTREGKIAGVCAGFADYFDIAHWVMRMIFIGAVIFTGTLAIWAYVGAWIFMSPRSLRQADRSERVYDYERFTDDDVEMEYDERRHDYRPKKVFRYSESGSVRLKRARERLDAALRRVEGMESYVTSRQYDLNNEFSKL
jgi:phage shock protein C